MTRVIFFDFNVWVNNISTGPYRQLPAPVHVHIYRCVVPILEWQVIVCYSLKYMHLPFNSIMQQWDIIEQSKWLTGTPGPQEMASGPHKI